MAFWVNELEIGATTGEALIALFTESVEFGLTVDAEIASMLESAAKVQIDPDSTPWLPNDYAYGGVLFNEAPIDLTVDNLTIDENAGILTQVGEVQALDWDGEEAFTYAITNQTVANQFYMIGNDIALNNPLDYDANPTHDITIEVTDRAGNTYEEDFTITVVEIA